MRPNKIDIRIKKLIEDFRPTKKVDYEEYFNKQLATFKDFCRKYQTQKPLIRSMEHLKMYQV